MGKVKTVRMAQRQVPCILECQSHIMTEEGRGECEGGEGIPKTKVTEKAGIQGG